MISKAIALSVVLLILGTTLPMAASDAGGFGKTTFFRKDPGQKKAKQYDGVLFFDPQSRTVRFTGKKECTVEIPYDKITAIHYERTAKPRYALAIAVTWLFLFSKSKSHYLTFEYTDSANTGQVALFRLHKDHYQLAVSTAESQTGKKVDRTMDN